MDRSGRAMTVEVENWAVPSTEEQIRHVLVVLAREIDRLDPPLIGNAFHTDAVLRSPALHYVGRRPQMQTHSNRQRIVEFLLSDLGSFAVTTHHLDQSQIEVLGDRSTAETRLTVHHLTDPGHRGAATDTVIGARWMDQLSYYDGAWKILSHVVEIDWRYDLPVNNAVIPDRRGTPDPFSFLHGRH